MAQLYIQRAAQPDTWVMSGAPAATAIWLSRDTPINYSDGTTDTLPANTPAVVTGGGTSFDRTHDVYVPYTVKGSGVLSIIKESLLPTLTSDYAPLARVELHGIKPYQPEPYLGAGGLGTVPTSAFVVASVAGLGRCFTLGSAPAGWQATAYDDSAWSAAVLEAYAVWHAPLGGTAWITVTDGPLTYNLQWLHRRTFVLPPGLPTGAVLQINADNTALGLWLNGTAVGTTPWGGVTPGLPASTIVLDPALLVPGGPNTLAAQVENGPNPGGPGGPWSSALDYLLTVSYVPSGGVAPGVSRAGDLLTYQGGAWTDLPIGASGQRLASDGAAPYWVTDPGLVSGGGSQLELSVTSAVAVGGSVLVPTAAAGTDYVVQLHLSGGSAATVWNALADRTAFSDVMVLFQGAEIDVDLDQQTNGAWSASSITLWFKLQRPIAAGGTDAGYSLRVGGAARGSPPRTWANIYPYSDDFPGSSLAGTWTNGIGGLHHCTVTVSGSRLTLAPLDNTGCSLGTTIMAGGASSLTTFRGQVSNGGPSTDPRFYTSQANFAGDDSTLVHGAGVYQIKQETGAVGTNVTLSSPTYPVGAGDHSWALARDAAGLLWGWIDGASPTAGHAGHESANAQGPAFFFGATGWASAFIALDWIKTRPWVGTEPVVTAGSLVALGAPPPPAARLYAAGHFA